LLIYDFEQKDIVKRNLNKNKQPNKKFQSTNGRYQHQNNKHNTVHQTGK